MTPCAFSLSRRSKSECSRETKGTSRANVLGDALRWWRRTEFRRLVIQFVGAVSGSGFYRRFAMVAATAYGILTMNQIAERYGLPVARVRHAYDVLFGLRERLGKNRVLPVADLPQLEREFARRGWVTQEAQGA